MIFQNVKFDREYFKKTSLKVILKEIRAGLVNIFISSVDFPKDPKWPTYTSTSPHFSSHSPKMRLAFRRNKKMWKLINPRSF